MKPIISPSILSADFAHLADDIDMLNQSEADWIHCDIMDGVFVPNISFGFPVLKHVVKLSNKPLDVHLMIVQPEKFIPEVKALGAYIMNVHYETCPHLHRVIQQIRDAGMEPAVTLSPSIKKTRELRDLINESGSRALIEIDGGVNVNTGARLIEAGADVLVAGNAVFSAADPIAAIETLKNL